THSLGMWTPTGPGDSAGPVESRTPCPAGMKQIGILRRVLRRRGRGDRFDLGMARPCEREMMAMAARKRVAMVLAKNFEDSEAIDPKAALEEQGAEVTIIGIERGAIDGKKGASLKADMTFREVTDSDFASFDLLVIPGGGSPENLRIYEPAVEFTRRFVESGRPVGSICHGPQLLISAGVLEGRRETRGHKGRRHGDSAGPR